MFARVVNVLRHVGSGGFRVSFGDGFDNSPMLFDVVAKQSVFFFGVAPTRFRGRPDLQREAGSQFPVNKTFSEINEAEYDGLVIAGAEYASIPVNEAVTEGNLVSAPAWPAHPAWLSQFMKLLGAKIEL